MHTFGLVVALCAGCGDPQQPPGPRLGVPDPNVDLGTGVGCARFQVVFDAGGAPTIEAIQNTGACPIGELKLLSDTAGSFDAVTGTLRVAVVMENVGTVAIIPRLKLRFNADSVERFNPQGNPIGGTSDVLGYLPDSSGAAGRIAFWWFDAYLAPSGQAQVLMPGARTQRRWTEFRGTTWATKVRLKLFATGVEQAAVPAIPPDSIPRWVLADTNFVLPTWYKSPVSKRALLVSFNTGVSQSSRQAAIGAVGGTVVGGVRYGTSGEGEYVVLVTATPDAQSVKAAISTLRGLPSVAYATPMSGFGVRELFLKPQDGAGFAKPDWRLVAPTSDAARNWSLEWIRAPLAWGCATAPQALRLPSSTRGSIRGAT